MRKDFLFNISIVFFILLVILTGVLYFVNIGSLRDFTGRATQGQLGINIDLTDCGDAVCGAGEDCNNCPVDCGVCAGGGSGAGSGSSGGSGSGAGSSGPVINYFMVESPEDPLEFEFSVGGERETKVVKVISLSDSLLDMVVGVHGVEDLVSLPFVKFELGPEEVVELPATASSDEMFGVYTGKIYFSSGLHSESIKVIITIESLNQFIGVDMPDKDLKVFSGDPLDVTISLFPIGSPSEGPVTIYYEVKDFEGNVIYRATEIFESVTTSESFVKTFENLNLPPGQYVVSAVATHLKSVSAANSVFTVEKKESKNYWWLWLIVLVLLIFILLFFLLVCEGNKKNKKKKN